MPDAQRRRSADALPPDSHLQPGAGFPGGRVVRWALLKWAREGDDRSLVFGMQMSRASTGFIRARRLRCDDLHQHRRQAAELAPMQNQTPHPVDLRAPRSGALPPLLESGAVEFGALESLPHRPRELHLHSQVDRRTAFDPAAWRSLACPPSRRSR